MSFPRTRQWIGGVSRAVLVLAAAVAMFGSLPLHAQDTLARKTKVKVAPRYPDMARRMNISGTVRVVVIVAPNGNLKSTKVVGGHPLLITAALDALKKWKFEPAADESSGIVEFKFQPE